MKYDEARSALILSWPDVKDAGSPALRRPFHGAGTAPLAKRLWQEVTLKRGSRDWQEHVGPLAGARRAALGEKAAGPPRVLIRVDEFPHARGFDSADRFGIDAYRRFHEVLTEAGVPYLLAITPRVSRDFLDPDIEEWRPLEDAEIELLHALQGDGVAFALHGLDHHTRYKPDRRHSEFCGLDAAATAERLDVALGIFAELGLETPIFVPPFNRFDASQYEALAERFEIVCGGPESVRLLGFIPPGWLGGALYLPSYRPLYGKAADAAAGLERLYRTRASLWAPVTFHWGWELDDDFGALRDFCARWAEFAVEWTELLAAAHSAQALTEASTRGRASEPGRGA
jgi:peptidoglycan/xylan/chitin deacetylase (PgdA/CDA1 family)